MNLKVFAVCLSTAVLFMTGHEVCAHEHKDHGGHEDFHNKRFNNAESWVEKFDGPAREAWQKPEVVIDALEIGENATIADIGAGTGYFAVRFAKRFPNAKILAVDVEPDMVAYIEKRAAGDGLKNIKPVLISTEEPVKLPDSVDLLFVADTYHHIPKRREYFANLGKFLKPNGAMAIIDFKLDSPEGPPVEHRIQPDQIREELKEAGFKQTKSFDNLPYQFFLIFKKDSVN